MMNNNISRIQRVSGRFGYFFKLVLIAIPLVDAIWWLTFNEISLQNKAALFANAPNDLPAIIRLKLFLVSLIPVGVVMFGVLVLVRLFKLYENAIVFAAENVKYYRQLGYIAIAWVIAEFIYTPLCSVIVSIDNPPGQRFITVGFELVDVTALVMGAVIVLISWVMDEGRKLADDQAHTV